MENLVWHCKDECLIAFHHHHRSLYWPIPEPSMVSIPVIINMNLNKYDNGADTKNLVNYFSKIDHQKFTRLKDLMLEV